MKIKIKKNVLITLAIVAVSFISGGVSGFFLSKVISIHPGPGERHRERHRPSPEMVKNMIRNRIFRRLGMNREQQQQAAAALDRWYVSMEKLRSEHAPQYRAVFNQFFEDLIPLLSGAQKKELEKIRSEFANDHLPPGPRRKDRARPRRLPVI